MTEATRFEMVAFVVRYILEILFDGSSQKKTEKTQKKPLRIKNDYGIL